MNTRIIHDGIACSMLLCLLVASSIFAQAGADELIPNPNFRDEDGDGIIEGWEVTTFILEKDRNDPRKQRLSLKIKQDSERQITGELSTIFQGPAGFHQITIRYLDESDGISLGKLLVNGKVVHMWDFDNIFFDYYRSETIDHVPLKKGDRITIWAANDFTEYCRIDSIRVIPSPQPPTASELEAMTPPTVTSPSFGELVCLRDHRDPLAEAFRYETQIKASRSSVVFFAQAGETVRVELIPNNPRSTTLDPGTLTYLGSSATGMESGQPPSAAAGVFLDPETGSGWTSFTTADAGLYRYEVRAATPVIDRPHVFVAPPKGRTPALSANGDFYCFVPRGTRAFAIAATALGGRTTEIVVLDGQGTLVKRTCTDPGQELAVRVPEGRDNAIWLLSIRGINPTLTLRGIPPFLATQPEFLLVPRDCVESTKPLP